MYFFVPFTLSPTMTKCVETKEFYLIQESSVAKIGLKLMKNGKKVRSQRGGKHTQHRKTGVGVIHRFLNKKGDVKQHN